MKCNELMVGDWIADEHGFPMQVVSIGNDYLYADFEGNEGDVVEFDDKDYKPYHIALTDEFFEKNNFDKNILYLYRGNIFSKIIGNNGYNVGVRLGDMLLARTAKVHYVHEVQQLLRFSGDTELANNIEL